VTTADKIIKMITGKPRTKAEIARTLGVSEKTVRNRLGEIHFDFEIGPQRFAVFRTGDRANAMYAIVGNPAPARKTVNRKQYKLVNTLGAIEGGVYNTIVYERTSK